MAVFTMGKPFTVLAPASKLVTSSPAAVRTAIVEAPKKATYDGLSGDLKPAPARVTVFGEGPMLRPAVAPAPPRPVARALPPPAPRPLPIGPLQVGPAAPPPPPLRAEPLAPPPSSEVVFGADYEWPEYDDEDAPPPPPPPGPYYRTTTRDDDAPDVVPIPKPSSAVTVSADAPPWMWIGAAAVVLGVGGVLLYQRGFFASKRRRAA